MPAIGTQRLLAQSLLPSPVASQRAREKKASSRPRSSRNHYRPFSQVVSEGFQASQAHLTELFERNSIALSMSFPDYSLREKGLKLRERKNERERGRGNEGHLRVPLSHRSASNESKNEHALRLRRGLTSKASLSSINHDIDVSPCPEHEDSMVTKDTYLRKKVWHRYGSMVMHPYPHDAVYMQSYDPVILENEKYSHILLQRLTSSIPTFNKSLDKPPSRVLDLGCGQGHWLLDASHHWPSADFLGFDLVDILLPEVQKRSNVQLVRGNFVKYRLPFPDKSFDLVRMANLNIAIPHDKWSLIITEAHRVLKVGGQLEIIDDELFFPYGTIPAVTSSASRRSQDSLTSGTRLYCNDITETDSNISSPTLRGSEVDEAECMLTDEVMTKLESHLAVAGCQRRSVAYFQQWMANRQVAQDMEETFTGMLRKRFVHPSPKDFLPDLLKCTFGSGNVGTTQTYNISLPPASFTHPTDPANGVYKDEKPACPDKILDKHLEEGGPEREQSCLNRGMFPLRHSAKAAGRLGISYTDLIVATASAQRSAHDVQYLTVPRTLQSSGIIISPSTFVPLNATEIEFHTCKWMHTLLGCRPAIFDYVRSHLDEMGREFISDSELKEALWTYECFRRQRFHWPVDSEHDPEGFTAPCIPNTRKLDYKRLIGGREEPVHIRTIRAYHATKTDITSLASLVLNSPSQ